MSSDKGKADPNYAKVSPAPAPPPEVRLSLQGSKAQGFNPKLGSSALHLLLGLGAILAIGGAIVAGGGWLLAAATPWVPIDVDIALGEATASQLASQQEDCTNPEAKKYVEQLAAPLLSVVDELPFEFSFRVVDDPTMNAMALPGGFVVVHSGLLEAAQSGDEVAGVIAHEIQHALSRHGTRRILRQMGGSAALALILGGTDLQALGQLGGELTGFSYSRSQEAEADERGVDLLLKAGINPSGFAKMFERISAGTALPPELLSTHPDPGDRAALAKKRTPVGATFIDLPSPENFSCHLEPSEPH